MSIAEIKKEASELNADEVIHLAAWFHHLARRNDAVYIRSLDDSFAAMDAGDRLSLQDYRRLADELDKSGL